MLAEKEEVCWDLAGLLPREGSLVVRPMVLGESALMPMAWVGSRVRMLLWLGAWVCAALGLEAYLLVDETGPLARVAVGQVERVAGELDIVALDQVGVVGACGL